MVDFHDSTEWQQRNFIRRSQQKDDLNFFERVPHFTHFPFPLHYFYYHDRHSLDCINMMSRQVKPPPEPIQKINRLLHKEPYSSICYSFYWAFLLCALYPLAGFYLLFKLGYTGACWALEEYILEKKDDQGIDVDQGTLGVVITGDRKSVV